MKIDELAAKWLELKAAENKAKSERYDIEKEIQDEACISSDEAGTFKANGEIYTVKFVFPVERKADMAEVCKIIDRSLATQMFKIKPEFSQTAYKKLCDTTKTLADMGDEDAADLVKKLQRVYTKAVEEKIGRPTVSVEETRG